MYTSTALAKKYGLEHYLDKPGELNQAIFNLLLLQETIQLEHVQKKRRDGTAHGSISVKRIAYGKFVAECIGDEKYRYAVETAFRAATEILAVIQRKRFVKVLLSMGVPQERVSEFCDSITIDDDTHCIDQE